MYTCMYTVIMYIFFHSSSSPPLPHNLLYLPLPYSVDNSEWMRNGDFIPTRMQAQQDAVNVVCRMKTRQNVENTVGLMSLAE